jgi:hypothetical protein
MPKIFFHPPPSPPSPFVFPVPPPESQSVGVSIGLGVQLPPPSLHLVPAQLYCLAQHGDGGGPCVGLGQQLEDGLHSACSQSGGARQPEAVLGAALPGVKAATPVPPAAWRCNAQSVSTCSQSGGRVSAARQHSRQQRTCGAVLLCCPAVPSCCDCPAAALLCCPAVLSCRAALK